MTQPKLKAKSKVIFEVKYGDFEQFIKEVYGVHLDFVDWQECGNHSTTALYAEKNPSVAPLTSETVLENRWEIMDDLCNKGLIEPGEYLIKVYW
jgi:hypothetical protein